MSYEIAARDQFASLDLTNPADQAMVFVQSGLFKGVRRASEAMAKVLAGKELGMGAFESMQALDIVEGKLRWTSHSLAAKVKESPKYDYRVRDWDATKCNIEFFEIGPDGTRESIGFGYWDDAMRARAGLSLTTRSGRPSNWGKHPDAMMFARAISRGVNAHCPDVTGGIRVYTEGDSFGPARALPTDDDKDPLDAALENEPDDVEVPATESADDATTEDGEGVRGLEGNPF